MSYYHRSYSFSYLAGCDVVERPPLDFLTIDQRVRDAKSVGPVVLDRGRHELVKETDPGAKECRIQRHLSPGYYELKIYRGREGIEVLQQADLRVREEIMKMPNHGRTPEGRSKSVKHWKQPSSVRSLKKPALRFGLGTWRM